MPEIEVTIDATQADQELDILENRALEVSEKIIDYSQKAYESFLLLLTIAGQSVPEIYAMTAQATFMAGQAIMSVAAAQSVSVWTFIQAETQAMMALNLFRMATDIRYRGSDASRKFNAMILLARTWIIR